ncbi:MAG: class I SAM-dependent methyltransferase [Blastocatellia bacterium]|nr:class I SAM-dependent methyltransferase [Blastocatellia bacterium]
MRALNLYSLLEWPWVYRLSQVVLAPGADKAITRELKDLLTQIPPAQSILDIGCGPSSWLWRLGLHPVGMDLLSAYTAAFSQSGEVAVTGSATDLPFPDNSFDGVWSIGLLHHLPDSAARQAVSEMMRVARPGGYVVIFDAVMPEPAWRRPLAWAIRKLDRGRYMRRQQALESILSNRDDWVFERVGYTPLGHEALSCRYMKTASVAVSDAGFRGDAS